MRVGQNNKMMKKIFLTTLFLSLAISVFAQDSELRKLNKFNEIRVSEGIDIVAEKGTENSIALEVSRIDIEDVITEVRAGKLYVRLSRGKYRSNRVKATLIYTEEIEEIEVSTGAQAEFQSTIRVDRLNIVTSTSGFVRLKAEAKFVDLGATTSGRIDIEGKADEVEVSASTGGTIYAYDLQSNQAYARANTGADVRVNAEERLRASAGTGGSVRYTGRPKTDISTNTGGTVSRGN